MYNNAMMTTCKSKGMNDEDLLKTGVEKYLEE
jgi:hypothetical protein